MKLNYYFNDSDIPFEYEVSKSAFIYAVALIFCDESEHKEESAKYVAKIIEEYDILDDVLLDIEETDIYNYFEDEAREQYEDSKMSDDDRYGVSNRDFM